MNGIAGNVRVLTNSATIKSGAGRVECGMLFDTLINFEYRGNNLEFDLSFNYNYGLVCTNNIPDELEFNFGSSSVYDGPRLARTGSSNGNATAGGLRFNDSNYDLDATFTSVSEVNQKERNRKTFTGQSEVILTDLLINKVTLEIQSGSGSITSSGSSSDGDSYQFNASVDYQGDGVAIVNINEIRYSINLTTGEITPL